MDSSSRWVNNWELGVNDNGDYNEALDEEHYYNFPSATLRVGLSVAGCRSGTFLYMSLLVETEGNRDIIINDADSCNIIVSVVGFMHWWENTPKHDWLTWLNWIMICHLCIRELIIF